MADSVKDTLLPKPYSISPSCVVLHPTKLYPSLTNELSICVSTFSKIFFTTSCPFPPFAFNVTLTVPSLHTA